MTTHVFLHMTLDTHVEFEYWIPIPPYSKDTCSTYVGYAELRVDVSKSSGMALKDFKPVLCYKKWAHFETFVYYGSP